MLLLQVDFITNICYLEAVYSSDVDGTQLHEEIQDCKMIVSRQVERIAL